MADSDDDWRVTLSVSHPLAGQPPSSLSQAEEDIRRQVGRGVGVGAGEGQIFLYAGTGAAAGEAERIGRDVLAQHGIAAESAVHRWHPIEERWETPDVPMPQTAAERQAEHQRLLQAETAESLATGQAQWEVRVELGSHRQAVALARKLEGEGRVIVRLEVPPPRRHQRGRSQGARRAAQAGGAGRRRGQGRAGRSGLAVPALLTAARPEPGPWCFCVPGNSRYP